MKYGRYLVLSDYIDNAIWATDFRYSNFDEAKRAAEKDAMKTRRDMYVADLLSVAEMDPGVDIRTTLLTITANEQVKIEDNTNGSGQL